MSLLLWSLPAVIMFLGLVPIAFLVRRVSDDAEEMRLAVRRFGDLRPALVELRTELATTRDAWEHLGRR